MLQDSAAALDTTYRPAHCGTHDDPDAKEVPAPHMAEFATVGSVQGSGSQTNVAGVSTAAVHASDEMGPPETEYPEAHVGAHVAPDARLPPAPQEDEWVTVGSAQASGEHDGGIPTHVPSG